LSSCSAARYAFSTFGEASVAAGQRDHGLDDRRVHRDRRPGDHLVPDKLPRDVVVVEDLVDLAAVRRDGGVQGFALLPSATVGCALARRDGDDLSSRNEERLDDVYHLVIRGSVR
jgi:hypothetical protein